MLYRTLSLRYACIRSSDIILIPQATFLPNFVSFATSIAELTHEEKIALYYCNMVEWFWCDSSLISTTNWFPSMLWHCWFGHLACKIVPEMTYYVSSGTLNPTHLFTHPAYLMPRVLKCLRFRKIIEGWMKGRKKPGKQGKKKWIILFWCVRLHP